MDSTVLTGLTDATVGPELAKAPTGIPGLDQITVGGLPMGRVTLVTGSAGAGKTLLGLEFLVAGARKYGEAGVLVTFEEPAAKVIDNARSLGFDLDALQRDGLLVLLSIRVDPAGIVATGEFDFEPLFVSLGDVIGRVGAKRVVLDTIDVLFGAFGDDSIVRAELSRLVRWLEDRGVTAIVTGERGNEGLTRHGIEEYISDCVIVLDHRVREEISTRRLRVVKYRGSAHGTNEYPFLISARGFIVLPITSLALDYGACDERIPTGIVRLDHMLGGGLFRGSTVLVSGTAGTGKSSIGAHLVNSACGRGERALLALFEESPAQVPRNMRSIGGTQPAALRAEITGHGPFESSAGVRGAARPSRAQPGCRRRGGPVGDGGAALGRCRPERRSVAMSQPRTPDEGNRSHADCDEVWDVGSRLRPPKSTST
jgi:circadian clock protein KaiC